MLQLENPKLEKLKLKFYPYTYVRTSVMRTLLLKKEEYPKLLKMSFNEIARYLQDSIYKKEIDSLASELSGAELLEIALNRNLQSSFDKLRMISSDELKLLINQYLKRKDVEDIKTILRGIYTKADKKLIINSLTGAGTLSIGYLKKLLEKDSIEDVLHEISIYEFSDFKNSLKEFEDKKLLIPIENALDRLYFIETLEFTERLPIQGELFKKFLVEEIEIKNLLTVLRLKKENLDKNYIKKYLIFSGNMDNTLLELVESDINNIPKILGKKDYRKELEEGIKDLKENNSLISLETGLFKYLLKKSILLQHQNPLSIDIILGYMFAKEIEVRNLKILIKGKQLKMPEEFIEKQVIA